MELHSAPDWTMERHVVQLFNEEVSTTQELSMTVVLRFLPLSFPLLLRVLLVSHVRVPGSHACETGAEYPELEAAMWSSTAIAVRALQHAAEAVDYLTLCEGLARLYRIVGSLLRASACSASSHAERSVRERFCVQRRIEAFSRKRGQGKDWVGSEGLLHDPLHLLVKHVKLSVLAWNHDHFGPGTPLNNRRLR